MRSRAWALLLLWGAGLESAHCAAEDVWGGSLALTSDYSVRGVSRTNHQAAVQLDLHYANTSGFLAGVFASNTQFDPSDARDAEINAFVGFAWRAAANWNGKFLASHYAYPWNAAGHGYDYDELALEVAYQDWIELAVLYSPNQWRYFPPDRLRGVTAVSTEINLQHRLIGNLSAVGGAGYSSLGGSAGSGYGYWSAGALYDWAPVTLAVSYVNTTAEGRTLFYNAVERGRWTGTAIWRF